MNQNSVNFEGPWIGVDLDGTLAYYDDWKGIAHIGEPILPMVERVKWWLREGKRVKILTARMAQPDEADRELQLEFIQDWSEHHIGVRLEVTNVKDFMMLELYDDRCVQVRMNAGTLLVDEMIALRKKLDMAKKALDRVCAKMCPNDSYGFLCEECAACEERGGKFFCADKLIEQEEHKENGEPQE